MSDNQPRVISDVAHPAQEPAQAQAEPQVQEVQYVDADIPKPNTQIIPEVAAEIASSDASNHHEPAVQEAHKKDSGNKPILLIIVAVLVAIALIGIAYAAFMQPEKSAENANVNSQQGQQEPAEVVDGAVIDQSTAEIDALVNELDDQADFPESELDSGSIGI